MNIALQKIEDPAPLAEIPGVCQKSQRIHFGD